MQHGHHGQWKSGSALSKESGRVTVNHVYHPPQDVGTPLHFQQDSADGLMVRLQNAMDTHDSVKACSHAMLHSTPDRGLSMRVWKDVFQAAIRDRNVGKALTLLYVVNDVLQCPSDGFRWQRDLGQLLCEVIPQALECARTLRAHDMHQKLTRMPIIWRDRRVLEAHIAMRLVDNCYDSTQELDRCQLLAPANMHNSSDSHHHNSGHPLPHQSSLPQPAQMPPPQHPPPNHNTHQHLSHPPPSHSPPSQLQPHLSGAVIHATGAGVHKATLHTPPPQHPPPQHPPSHHPPSQHHPPTQHLAHPHPHPHPHHPPAQHLSSQPTPQQYPPSQHTTCSPRQHVQLTQGQAHHLQHAQSQAVPQSASHSHGSHVAQSTSSPSTTSANITYSNNNTVHTQLTHALPVAPDGEQVARQVELEQARFDIDEVVGLLQLVKKLVLERKLLVFEQKHAEARQTLEMAHAAACSRCFSAEEHAQAELQSRAEIASFEAQHEQEAELLRVKWVLELKKWADDVAMLRECLHQKIPDARWLSDLLRKAHRAQRCVETAVELETFLDNYCADPDQALLPDMWNKAPAATLPVSSSIVPLHASPADASQQQPPPQDLALPPAGMNSEREEPVQDPLNQQGADLGTGEDDERLGKRGRPGKNERERLQKHCQKPGKKEAAAEPIDDSCPLYRCQGCDKVFAVRGMLSVADLSGLNVGTRRYFDSKTARAARDTHRRDAHPNLQIDQPKCADSPAAAAVHATNVMHAVESIVLHASNAVHTSTPSSPGPVAGASALSALASQQSGDRERVSEGSKIDYFALSDSPVNPPPGADRFHGAAVLHNGAAPLKDPRLSKCANTNAAGSGDSNAAARRMPTEDFVPAPTNGTREDMPGYVYKYGVSGVGYYRIVASESRVLAPSSIPSPVARALNEQDSGGGVGGARAYAPGSGVSSTGKKTIAEMIQERTRQKEEAERERLRKEVENQLRLEAEAKLREELRLMKEQLERDRITQQLQKEAEEREREAKQQLQEERLRAELRAMKEQLDRKERASERELEQRRQHDTYNQNTSRPGKSARSPPRAPRITMEDRMSARPPSPPSPLRERIRRAQEDSDVEDGEIREVSPPRPTLGRINASLHAAQQEHEQAKRRRSPDAAAGSHADAAAGSHADVAAGSHADAAAGSHADAAAGSHADAAAGSHADAGIQMPVLPQKQPGESCGEVHNEHEGVGGDEGETSDGTDTCKDESALKINRRGVYSRNGGKGFVGMSPEKAAAPAAANCSSKQCSGAVNAQTGKEADKGVEKGRRGRPPRQRQEDEEEWRGGLEDEEAAVNAANQLAEEEAEEDAASAHGADDDKRRGVGKGDKVKGARAAAQGRGKRKAGSGGCTQGKSKMSKAAMLKDFSRTEVRAGEALLALYDYYSTAQQQIESIAAAAALAADKECATQLTKSQIEENLLERELQDAVAARIQLGARVKAKWRALKGGLVWYTGTITLLHSDHTVDVMYDDGDAELKVERRFIELLDKQPTAAGPAATNKSANARAMKRKPAATTAQKNATAKRRLAASMCGNATAAEAEDAGEARQEGAPGDADAEQLQQPSHYEAVFGSSNNEEDNLEKGNATEAPPTTHPTTQPTAQARRGKKPTNARGKAKCKEEAKAKRGGVAGGGRQGKTRSLITQELPDAQPQKPLEECLIILNAVLDSKAAAPLATAGINALCPLLVKSTIEVLGKNAEKTPMDFVSIRRLLTKTCQARAAAAAAGSAGGHAAVGHYKSAQQVREDIVRIIRLVSESLGARHAMRVCCGKVLESFNDHFESRISPSCHQLVAHTPDKDGGGLLPFPHGLHWLGQRVRVFWKDDFVWYTGCIDDHYGLDQYHIVYDDDGWEEWICLPSVNVHMINVNWEPEPSQRLLLPGDPVLALDIRSQELGSAGGVLFQGQVRDTRPSHGTASIRWSRGVWPLPDAEEEEELSDEEEWLDVADAKVLRCDTNVACHYSNGRVQAEEDETVREIATRYNLEDVKLAHLNRIEHPTITPTSKLVRGTLLLLPQHPSIAQRLAEDAAQRRQADVSHYTYCQPRPYLAGSAVANAEETEESAPVSRARESGDGWLRERGRMGSRHACRQRPLLYGSMAVRAGACEQLLGARVVVECVNSRLLGSVACYDAATLCYHILLDTHGAVGGLGDVAVQKRTLATLLPCPDVHVMATMSQGISRASTPEAEPVSQQQQQHASLSGSTTLVMPPHVPPVAATELATESSPETPPLQVGRTSEQEQLRSLVGMTVTRGFDGVLGKVSALVPGSDVVIIEWADGDSEDMHVTDMQRQGLL